MVPEIGPEDRAGAGLRYPCRREGGRADEGGGLENRLRGDPYVGSNPTPPAYRPWSPNPEHPSMDQAGRRSVLVRTARRCRRVEQGDDRTPAGAKHLDERRWSDERRPRSEGSRDALVVAGAPPTERFVLDD